jgi:hypothetical protein
MATAISNAPVKIYFCIGDYHAAHFSISLDLAAKGPHYEISPIFALTTRVCDFGGLRRSPIWEMTIDRQRSSNFLMYLL